MSLSGYFGHGKLALAAREWYLPFVKCVLRVRLMLVDQPCYKAYT